MVKCISQSYLFNLKPKIDHSVKLPESIPSVPEKKFLRLTVTMCFQEMQGFKNLNFPTLFSQ